MDELTQERYGPLTAVDLDWEMCGRRGPSPSLQLRNRRDLCGTDDLSVMERGGAVPGSRKARRLLEVIRTWRA